MVSQLVPIIISLILCVCLISFRCGYRLLRRCRLHTGCFRTWHRDDTLMVLSLLVLAARVGTIAESVVLLSRGSSAPDQATSARDVALGKKLLLPGRIFYALFLWCMKFCLLDFYTRLSGGLPSFVRAASILRLCLVLTFLAIIPATLLECRPMSLYWNGQPEGDRCRQARGNYITMGTFDLLTDIALLIFPVPIVWRAGMDMKKQIRVGILFSFGLTVVIITIARLPLTLRGDVSQKIRSLWADIEIACACLVANVASFYYPLVKEISEGHPVASGDTIRRGTRAQQWERSRRPSYPVREIDEDDLDPGAPVTPWPTVQSESSTETFEEWESRCKHLLHIEEAGIRKPEKSHRANG